MKIILVLGVLLFAGIVAITQYWSRPARGDEPTLIAASRAGDLELVRRLIASGTNVNERGKTGGTPLFFAAGNDHVKIAKELLSNGADIDATDNKGRTAIFANLQNEKDSVEMLEFLVLKGTSINLRDKFGFSALHVSLDIGGSFQKTKFLIEHGIEVNTKSKDDGNFPLEIAVSWGDLRTVSLLLENGADPDLQRRDGHTALMEACRQNNKDIIVLLLKKGASASIKNSEGLIAVDMLPTDSVEMRTLLQARH